MLHCHDIRCIDCRQRSSAGPWWSLVVELSGRSERSKMSTEWKNSLLTIWNIRNCGSFELRTVPPASSCTRRQLEGGYALMLTKTDPKSTACPGSSRIKAELFCMSLIFHAYTQEYTCMILVWSCNTYTYMIYVYTACMSILGYT